MEYFFYLKMVFPKVRDEKLAEYYYSEKAIMRTTNLESEDILKSTVLIGLKSSSREGGDNLEKWDYRTILVRAQNKSIVGIYEMEDIFFPRKTGFWKLSVDRIKDVDDAEDNIIISPIKKVVSDTKGKVATTEEIMEFEARNEDGDLIIPDFKKKKRK